jgi:flagellar basal body rod protein FlgC
MTMKVLSIVLPLIFLSLPAFSCPTTAKNACDMMTIARHKLELVESNIANVNTTRTPEGGPYRRKWLACKGTKCTVRVSKASPLLKYEPDHVDANADGYVPYPNLSLEEEMKNTLAFSRDFEFAEKVCVNALMANR